VIHEVGESCLGTTHRVRAADAGMLAVALVLVVIALVLLLAEAHVSTGGLIAAGAAIALVCGIAMLLISAAVGLVAVLVVSVGVGLTSISGVALLARGMKSVGRLRPRSGSEAMVGHLGVMRVNNDGARVFVDGGLWRARPSPLDEDDALHDGDRVVVERVNGLTLCVRRAEELELNP
jgi:membrane protein implicated in regulation of membrane protease activity